MKNQIIAIDNKSYIRCKAIMLPINKFPQIGDLSIVDGILRQTFSNIIDQSLQCLYIISDEEIKENDWFYNEYYKSIKQNNFDSITKDCKKIITTNDASLGLPQLSQQFIQHYIEKYNKADKVEYVCKNCNEKYPYVPVFCGDCGCTFSSKTFITNKSGAITEVLVEVEECSWQDREYIGIIDETKLDNKIIVDTKCGFKLKLDSQKQIIVKQAKDTYTRSELIQILNKFAYDVAGNGMLITAQLRVSEYWLEKNL